MVMTMYFSDSQKQKGFIGKRTEITLIILEKINNMKIIPLHMGNFKQNLSPYREKKEMKIQK